MILVLALLGCTPAEKSARIVGEDSGATTPGGTTASTGSPSGGTPGGTPTTSSWGNDYRGRGPYAVLTVSSDAPMSSGCDIAYDRYTADGGPDVPILVLAHGLQRTKAQMATMADHLASWGLDVAAPTLCAKDLWNIDQERNGRDMTELAFALAPGPALYAGHSAGGLATFVAASVDPNTVAMLGLDAVDVNGIADAAIPLITAPMAGLIGDPGTCNLSNNMDAQWAAIPGAYVWRVTDADHCDFEHPTDAVCTIPCGTSPNDQFTDPEIGATVMALTTAWMMTHAGLDPSGLDWWVAGGAPNDFLVAEGAIGPL